MKASKAILLGTVSTIWLSHVTVVIAAQPGAPDRPIIIAQAPPAPGAAPAEPDPRQKKEPGARPPGAPQRPGGPTPGQPPQHAPGAPPPPAANQGPPPGAKQPGLPPAQQPPTQA